MFGYPVSKSESDPWPVILGYLFELDSYYIPQIIDKTGMVVDWTLTEREDYSHKYRKAAYRPRINGAYDSLSEQDRLRVAYIVASELADRGRADALNATLEQIGWRLEQGRLTPARADDKELFFPKDTVPGRKDENMVEETITQIEARIKRAKSLND